MSSRFSSPMPCSPLSTPPAATHARSDRVAGRVDPCPDAGIAGVEDEDRMEVAVTGVEDVDHDQVVFRRDLVDLAQNLEQPGAGHHCVVQVVVGFDPGDRAERRLAAFPEERALGRVCCDPHSAGPVRAPDLLHDRDRGLDPGRQAVDLGEQDRVGVTRVPGADEVLDRLGDPCVHHLERRGDDPCGDDGADGLGRVVDGREVEEQGPDAGGSGWRRTAMRVAIPIVPSLPTKHPRRSRPG